MYSEAVCSIAVHTYQSATEVSAWSYDRRGVSRRAPALAPCRPVHNEMEKENEKNVVTEQWLVIRNGNANLSTHRPRRTRRKGANKIQRKRAIAATAAAAEVPAPMQQQQLINN